MSAVLFFLGAIGVIAGALGVVILRDPFFAVLALVGHLLSLAVLFLLLRAEFVAAVQVVVYAGAVMVLYVFVVAYVGDAGEGIGERLRSPARAGSNLRIAAVLVAGSLMVELFIALLGTGLQAINSKGAGYSPGPQAFGTPAYIGKLLLTRFLLVFEVSSLLLTIAAVGAVVLARRRGGLEEPVVELKPLNLLRPRGTGTMAEGVSSLAFAGSHDRPEEFQVQVESARAPASVGASATGADATAHDHTDAGAGGGW
jgi:NADH-quinone oxidoreductase subunit J